MRLAFVTDIHASIGRIDALADAVGAVDVLLLGGDLTNFGRADDARRVTDAFRARFPRLFAVHGNVDHTEVRDGLADEGLSLHGRAVAVDGVTIQGLGGANHTPMRTPSESSEEELAAVLARGAAHAASLEAEVGARVRVLVSHCPPHGTTADRLTWGRHVGSTAVRAFLDAHAASVAVCLCGHVHEGVGTDRVGPVLVCNPGAFLAGGYAILEVTPERTTCRIEKLPIPAHQRVADTLGVFGAKVVRLSRHHLSKARGGSRGGVGSKHE